MQRQDPKADVNVFFIGCGAVYNNPELTQTAERAVENIVGKENNLYVERSWINEDFSHYRKIAPSVFAFVGCNICRICSTISYGYVTVLLLTHQTALVYYIAIEYSKISAYLAVKNIG